MKDEMNTEGRNENLHEKIDNQTEEEVEQFLSYLGLREELYHIFLSKEINSLEKILNLENFESSKIHIDEKKKNLIQKNLANVMEGIKFYYINKNSNENESKPTFLSIIREVFYDLDGITLTKEILLNGFKLKSMPNNNLPKHLKNENIKPDKIFATFLQNRSIGYLTNLEGFKNLKHLYLNNNRIQKMENLNFPSLTILELSNNFIRKIENLDNLDNLQTLNLDKNFISIIENLFENKNLESLSLNDQILTKNQTFEINTEGILPINIISNLSLENCNLYDATNLFSFPNLKNLNLASNRIFDFISLLDSLNSMTKLNFLSIKNNPFTETNKNFRDLILIKCGSLEEINGKTVTENEKQFVNSLYLRKMMSHKNNNNKDDRTKITQTVKSSTLITHDETASFLKIKKIISQEAKLFSPSN